MKSESDQNKLIFNINYWGYYGIEKKCRMDNREVSLYNNYESAHSPIEKKRKVSQPRFHEHYGSQRRFHKHYGQYSQNGMLSSLH